MSEVVTYAERRLRELRAARDAVTTNLLDLEAEGAYALLKAGDGLSGATALKAKPALARLPELWRGLELLDDLIDRADAQRGTGGLNERRARELSELLDGPSITLPAETVPLAQRQLTGSSVAVQTTTATTLLAGMEATFEAVRDVVTEVDAAWRDLLGRVQQATAALDQLPPEAAGDPQVTTARTTLDGLATRVADDPLGATADLERAEAALDTVQQAITDRRARATRLDADLATARTLLAELERLVGEGRLALDRSRAEVARPEGLLEPLDPAILTGETGLRPWLNRLDQLAVAGDVDKAGRGYQRWRQVADDTLAAARQVAAANTAPTTRRQELRGLLRAAKAKAAASGRAEDAALTQLARRASQVLGVPCDLPAAAKHVAAYVDALRSHTRKDESR